MNHEHSYLLEACVENARQGLIAQMSGADQIELCSHLDLEGLTPSIEEVQECLHILKIPVKVMIRPFPGNFISNEALIETMIKSIGEFKKLGVSHVVFGLTTPDKELDLRSLQKLIAAARPMDVTIHKAIDTCLNPIKEAKRLTAVEGITSILTSGGAPKARIGASVIKEMIQAVSANISIIAAGKITKNNLDEIHKLIDAPIYHGRRIIGPVI